MPNILSNGEQHSEICIFNKHNIILIKELPRIIQIGGNMNPINSVKIISAISLDNEFTRNYTKVMKDFSKTFIPLSNHSIIKEQNTLPNTLQNNVSYITESSKISENHFNKKHRKTRKRIKL